MSFGKSFRLAAFAVFLATSASASTITSQFSSFWVLGDSLSGPVVDPLTLDPVPNPFTGAPLVASDGPLWSQRIVQQFTDAGKTARNFAIAGATAGLTRPIDLAAQTQRLLDTVIVTPALLGARPLAAIWIGGNDIEAISTGGATLFDTVGSYAATFANLIGAGFQDFLVFEIPDVGATPLINGTPNQAAATGLTALLNTIFFTSDVALPNPLGGPAIPVPSVVPNLPSFVEVTKIDTFALSQIALSDPGFFGLSNVGPCVGPLAPVPAPPCSDSAFWDAFHPTSVLHQYLTAEVRAAYAAPIPLPAAGWLLIAAMGGLVALRRRA